MQTEEAKVVNAEENLFVNLPLTRTTGKIRVKQRSFFSEYGVSIAPRKTAMSQSCYVEWQIGYDLLASAENNGKTSLADRTFRNYKGEAKYAYELGEVLRYAYVRGLICDDEIRSCFEMVRRVANESTFEETAAICRTNPRERTINGLAFYEMQVSYPLFVHRVGPYEIFAEIMVREAAGCWHAGNVVCLPPYYDAEIFSPRFGTDLGRQGVRRVDCRTRGSRAVLGDVPRVWHALAETSP